MLGSIFIYSFSVSGLLVDLFGLEKTTFDMFKNIFIYISLIFFILAASEIYEISKVLGFASEKTPKKLKKILKSE